MYCLCNILSNKHFSDLVKLHAKQKMNSTVAFILKEIAKTKNQIKIATKINQLKNQLK